MANYYTPGTEEDRQWSVETLEDGRYQAVGPGGKSFIVDAFSPVAGRVHMLVDGKSWDMDAREIDGEIHVQWRGLTKNIKVLNDREKRMAVAGIGGSKAAGPELLSPMAGKVVAIKAQIGDEVKEGQVVLIIEAMKMENDLKAHRAGRIESVNVSAGEAVEVGTVLITIAE